jgi:hypothetical protein
MTILNEVMRNKFWEGITVDGDFVKKFSKHLYPFLIEHGYCHATGYTDGVLNYGRKPPHLILNRSVNLHTGEFESVSFSLKGITTYEMFSCRSDGYLNQSSMGLKSDLGKFIKEFVEEYHSLRRDELIEEIFVFSSNI